MPLADALVRVLDGGRLDDLAACVGSAGDDELAAWGADVVAAYAVRGRAPPAGVAARITLPAPPPPLPAEGDWEQLAAWAVAAAPLALPGVGRDALGGREEDLWRGVGLALMINSAPIAARLVRWLTLSAPAAELRDATADALRIARQRKDGLVPALIAREMLRVAAAEPRRARPSAPAAPPPATPIEETSLRALRDRALGWVEHDLGRFSLAEDVEPVPRFKSIGELAVVAAHASDAATRAGEPALHRRADALLAHARAQLADGERLASLIEGTPALASFATILPPFHAAGLRCANLDRAITRHAGALAPDLHYLVGVGMRDAGIAPPWDLDVAWRATRIHARPTPWRLATTDLYLLLHEAWYRAADGWPDDPALAYLTRWLPVWLRYAEMVGHHDLLAELLITWHAVFATPAPAAAWTALIGAQRPDGAIPTTRHDADPGRAIMTDPYHATLNTIWAVVTHPAPAHR